VLLVFGVGALIAATFILLGISDAGYMEMPFYQRVLGAFPFVAFGVWTIYDAYLVWNHKDKATKRKDVPWIFTVFVVASILLLLIFGGGP